MSALFEPPQANASPLPAADVRASTAGLVEYEAFPVRKPEADLNDFKIQVRASTLARCRSQLEKLTKSKFSWSELALGVSTSAAGAVLGAIPAEIDPKTVKYFFFFSFLPALFIGGLVAYVFLRRTGALEAASIARDVLQELPHPDQTR